MHILLIYTYLGKYCPAVDTHTSYTYLIKLIPVRLPKSVHIYFLVQYIGQLRKLTEDFIISVVDQETDEKRIRLRNILRRREHILLEVGRTIRLGRLLKSRLREPLHDDNNCAG